MGLLLRAGGAFRMGAMSQSDKHISEDMSFYAARFKLLFLEDAWAQSAVIELQQTLEENAQTAVAR